MNPASASGSMNLNAILSGLLFGGIGTAAFFYGRKQMAWKPMVIGALLVGETYFLKDAKWIWAAGVGLTAALWIFRHD